MKFAIIGGGVVGRCYAQALAESGAEFVGALDIAPGEALRRLAAEHGVAIHAAAGPWLAEADHVFSAVFGSASLAVAERVLPAMTPGAIYVDMTTATPETMREAAALAAHRGVGFVDVAVTGAVNVRGAKTPMLCSGERASAAARMFGDLGAPVRVVGERAGDATRLKLLRSIFTKGLEALAIECLATAEAAGLRPQLHDVLLDVDQTPLQALMETLVTTHVQHAARRRDEVVEAGQLMRAHGIEPVVLPAVQALFERTVDALGHDPLPGSGVDAALAWLSRSAATARAS